MSFLIAAPGVVSAAAGDLAGIGSTISAANSAAAAAITGVAPAALDQVSAGVAALFDSHGTEYQELSAQVSQFHEQFVQALTAGANAYANTEANIVRNLADTAASPE